MLQDGKKIAFFAVDMCEGGREYSFVARLRRLTIDHASRFPDGVRRVGRREAREMGAGRSKGGENTTKWAIM